MHPVGEGNMKYKTSQKETDIQSPFSKILTSLQNCKHMELTLALWFCS